MKSSEATSSNVSSSPSGIVIASRGGRRRLVGLTSSPVSQSLSFSRQCWHSK